MLPLTSAVWPGRASLAFRGPLVVCLALLSASACAHDAITRPQLPLVPPLRATATSLGTYTIPIPPNNTDNAVVPLTGTGIVVPAGVYYRVRVNGTVTVTPNPEHQTVYPGNAYTWAGTYGPGGTGNYWELEVVLGTRNTDGTGTSSLNLPNIQGGSSAPDSARTAILYASKAVEIQAGRHGIACVTNDNGVHGPIGCYDLQAAEVVTVEQVTDFIHLTAAPGLVHPNHTVTFTATRDDGQSPYVTGWHWDPDPGASGSVTSPCWWYNPCQFSPSGSGTMTVHTNMGDATAHVTVYTAFGLTAAPSTIAPEDTVTFTPTADGVATAVARWRWVPADTGGGPVSCPDGSAVCRQPVSRTGTMWAYTAAGVNQGDSAAATVAVAPATVTVTASRSTIGEGDTVTFTATVTPNHGYTIVGWSWQSDDAPLAARAPASPAATGPERTVAPSTTARPAFDEVLADTDTVSATEDDPLNYADDRPEPVACSAPLLTCTIPIAKSGTMTFAVRSAGVLVQQSVHVQVDYVCPDVFPAPELTQVPPDELVVQTAETSLRFGPLGSQTVWMHGPYTRVRKLGTDFRGIPEAIYEPTVARDAIGHENLVPGSGAIFLCRVWLGESEHTGDIVFLGQMVYAYKLNIWWWVAR